SRFRSLAKSLAAERKAQMRKQRVALLGELEGSGGPTIVSPRDVVCSVILSSAFQKTIGTTRLFEVTCGCADLLQGPTDPYHFTLV
ncbi:MAG: hypothetical protein AAF623_17210, partial [Planctomycetota bacterium]